MKWLKIALIGIGGLLAVVLIAGAIAPKEYAVERTVVINKPATEVFEYIKLLKNQDFISTETKGGDATEVTWGFDGAMPHPMNLMLLTMDMDAMLGDQLGKGLENLKGLLE